MKIFFGLAILILAAVIGYPLLNENTTNACRAVEHRFMGLTTEQQARSDNPISAALATVLADAVSEGEIAAAFIKHRHPDKPPMIGCTVVYWQAIFDPDTLRPPQRRDSETQSGRIQQRAPVATPLDRAADDASQSYDAAVLDGLPRQSALENTLEKLRALNQQTVPPRRVDRGDRPSDNTSEPTAAERGAIADYVRRCWSTDPGMLDLDRMQVLLAVTTDASGIARRVSVAPEEQGRVAADARLRVFSERAIRAVLDPNCSNLPLPQTMLGQARTFTVRFKP